MDSTKPPGSDPRGLRQDNAAAKRIATVIVDDGSVVTRLWQLRERYGYFTRAEIEAAIGVSSPRGHWQCTGQFGPDGRWLAHCEAAA